MKTKIDAKHHDYDCMLHDGVPTDTDCDCGMGDARERWQDLMSLYHDSTRRGPFRDDLTDELNELDKALADHAKRPVCKWTGLVSYETQVPFPSCGLNGDWSVSAWHIDIAGTANRTDGGCYLLDDENGCFSIVRRWYVEDDNDRIEVLGTWDSVDHAIAAARVIRRRQAMSL